MKSKWKTPIIILCVLSLFLVVCYSGPKGNQIVEDIKLLFQKVEPETSTSDIESDYYISNNESKNNQESIKESYPSDVEEKKIDVRFTLSSVQEDLYISILDKKGNYINEKFSFTVKSPDGKKVSYTTSQSGIWYKTDLSKGKYEVTLQDLTLTIDHEQYHYNFAKTTQSIVVNEKVTPHIISYDELRASIATSVDEEELIGDQDDKGEAEEIEIELIETDLYSGYVYTFTTSPNGYLWEAGTNKTIESDVKPVLDENGFLVYGLRDDGMRVELFYPNGEPFPDYDLNFGPPEGAKLGEQIENGKRYYFKADGTVIEGPGLKKINNKLYYITSANVVSSACGIDISAYQTVTDWSKVKASGIDFVILRIGGRGWGTGALFEDSKGLQYLSQAKAAGLKVGVYFFSAAINTQEAVEEASLCLDLLENKTLDYPIFFDTEYCNTSHTGRSDSLSPDQRTLIAKTFCETIESAGYQAGIYASASFFCSQLNMSELDQYMFWMAHYTKNYALSTYNVKYKIWQFTSSGSVDGITGRVDMNTIFE